MARETVPLPAPDGPSIAITSRFIRDSHYTKHDGHEEIAGRDEGFVLKLTGKMPRRRLRMLLIVVLIVIAIVYFAAPYARAMALIVRVAAIGGPAQALVSIQDNRVEARPRHMVPTRQDRKSVV